MRYGHLLCLLVLLSPFGFSQDAVNPCAIDTESMDCSGPDGEAAEIKLHKIKLNGKRRTDPVVPANQDLVISAKLKYTNRGKAVVTTTFTGGCPNRVETKRIKPEVPVTYIATLFNGASTTNYSGSGLEFTIPYADISVANPELNVTFSVSGSPSCINMGTSTTTVNEHFEIAVDDGGLTGTITVFEDLSDDDTDYSDSKRAPVTFAPGVHFMRNRAIKLRAIASFASLSGPLADPSSIQWSINFKDGVAHGAGSPGSFSKGSTGPEVFYEQGDLEYGEIYLKAEVTQDGEIYKHVFPIIIFHIDKLEGLQMEFNETRQFVIPEAAIHPNVADKAQIAALLSQPETVGDKESGTRLRTREYTGKDWNNLNQESFTPIEVSQSLGISLKIERALYRHIGNTLVLEVESGDTEGTFNITWERKRLFKTGRFFLHRALVEVGDHPVPPTLTLVKQGTNDTGPFDLAIGEAISLEAFTSTTWEDGTGPTWTIAKPATSAITDPATHNPSQALSFDVPGTYTVTISDRGASTDMTLLVYGIDLAVDSDNNNGAAIPDITPAQDAMEDVENDPTQPGKIIYANTGDADGDLIPDYADGFDYNGDNGNDDTCLGGSFTPVILTIPEPTDLSVAKVIFSFDSTGAGWGEFQYIPNASDPDLPDIKRKDPATWGRNRLWTRDANFPRNSDDVSAGGHMISMGAQYLATDLGFSAAPGSPRHIIVYFEALHGSDTWGMEHLQVRLDHDGDGLGVGNTPIIAEDQVRFTAVEIDLTSDADVRSFHGPNPNNGLETLNVTVKPSLALTGGTISWQQGQVDFTADANPWNDQTGTVEFQQDAGGAWGNSVMNDDDTSIEMRAKKPGRAHLDVTYQFGAYQVTQRRGLSVPKYFILDFTYNNSGVFTDDLEYVGLQNATTGAGPSELTGARQTGMVSTMKTKIVDWAYHRYDTDINVRFTETKPPHIANADRIVTRIGGRDGTSSPYGHTVTVIATGYKYIEVFSNVHAKRKDDDDVSRYDATRTTPLQNSDYNGSGDITRNDVLVTMESFSRMVGDTLAHEIGHALGHDHHKDDADVDGDGNTTEEIRTGHLMDSGGFRTWGIKNGAPTGFEPTYKANLVLKLPRKSDPGFK